MSKLKVLSGQDIKTILESFGFKLVAQKGSHIKLKRIKENEFQTLTIPNHTEMDKGTLKAIFNQASRYVSKDELRKHFYTR